jgi:ferredoxin
MKNLKGCMPDSEKRRFHTLGLHRPIAALNMLLKIGYSVVDGICGDLTFEEGGNPVETNRIIAGRNPLTLDSYCAGLIGYRPDEIEYLSYGKEFGLGEFYTPQTELVEINPQNKPLLEVKGNRQADSYQALIHEDAACSACYSSLIFALHRLGGKIRAEGKLHIGQGFREKGGPGVGIGRCAQGFTKCVPGCPPKAIDIIEALQ